MLLNPPFVLEPDNARKQRQMALCKAMAEHGMKLAEAVAAQACAAITDDPKYFRRQAFLFTRLTHAVRQAIALENRIANGQLIRRRRTEGVPAPKSSAKPSAAPHAERLDANFDSVPDEEIPLLLARIGADLGYAQTRELPAPPPPPPPEAAPQPLTPHPRPKSHPTTPNPPPAPQRTPTTPTKPQPTPPDTS